MREAGGNSESDMNGGEFSSGESGGRETGGAEIGGEKSGGYESGKETGGEVKGFGELEGAKTGELLGQTGSEQKETAETNELDLAQSQIEQVHQETLSHLLETDKEYFSAENLQRIESGVTNIQAVAEMPAGKTGVYRFDGHSSTIMVRSVNEGQRERTAIHETLHFASHNREVVVPMPEKNGYMVYHTVGTHRSSWFHSARTGENYGFTEQGKGLNEGITTVLTNRRLSELSPEKGEQAQRQQVYGHAADIVAGLEQIVGESAIKEAYLGGKNQELEAKVDQLAGEKVFGRLSGCLDRAISAEYAERVAATREAQEILAQLSRNAKQSEGR